MVMYATECVSRVLTVLLPRIFSRIFRSKARSITYTQLQVNKYITKPEKECLICAPTQERALGKGSAKRKRDLNGIYVFRTLCMYKLIIVSNSSVCAPVLQTKLGGNCLVSWHTCSLSRTLSRAPSISDRLHFPASIPCNGAT